MPELHGNVRAVPYLRRTSLVAREGGNAVRIYSLTAYRLGVMCDAALLSVLAKLG